MPWCSTLAGWAGIRRTGIPGRTLTCPGLVRPLLVEIKFRPGAKGPALSLGGEMLRLLGAGVALVSPVGDWHASMARGDAPSCCSPPILCR